MEVSARVIWSGVGVALKTDTPTSRAGPGGVAAPCWTTRPTVAARGELQDAYAGYRGASRAAESILEVAGRLVPSA